MPESPGMKPYGALPQPPYTALLVSVELIFAALPVSLTNTLPSQRMKTILGAFAIKPKRVLI